MRVTGMMHIEETINLDDYDNLTDGTVVRVSKGGYGFGNEGDVGIIHNGVAILTDNKNIIFATELFIKQVNVGVVSILSKMDIGNQKINELFNNEKFMYLMSCNFTYKNTKVMEKEMIDLFGLSQVSRDRADPYFSVKL